MSDAISQLRDSRRRIAGVVMLLVAMPLTPVWGEGQFLALGAARKLAVPLQRVNNEWLAALAGVLPDFGVRIEYDADTKTMRITSPDGRSASLTAGKAELLAGSASLRLATAPVIVNNSFMVPVTDIARWLGLSLRVNDEGDLELSHGVLDVRARACGEKFVVEIVASGPVSYTHNRLQNPDRVYVDVKDADFLAADRTTDVKHALVRSVRAGQFSIAPNVTRVVIDLASDVDVSVTRCPRDCVIKVVLTPPTPEDRKHPFQPQTGKSTPPRGTFPNRGLATPRATDPAPQTLAQTWLVVIDAGHGGKDPGAIGNTGLQEKEVVLDIATRLADMLQASGMQVLLTRSDDTYIALKDRVAIAENNRASIFVSVHVNAAPTPNRSSGTEVYYYTPQSLPLAQCVHASLIQALGRKDGGIRQRRYYVIHHTTMPSVLTEIAYINHSEEEQLLSTSEFRERAARAICTGIQSYTQQAKSSAATSAAATVIEVDPLAPASIP